MMVRGVNRGSPARRIAAVALGLALVIVACEAPPPTATEAVDAVAGKVAPARTAEGVRVALPEGATPLFLVDGVRVDGKPELDPERIARVEVVKGEAARAQYGADAEHGAVLIYTEEPAGGEDAERLRRETIERAAAAAREVGLPPAPGETLGKLRATTPGAGDGALDGGDPPEVFLDGVLFEGDLRTIDKTTIDRIEVQKEPEGGPSAIRVFTKG